MVLVEFRFPVSPETFRQGNFQTYLGIDYRRACHSIACNMDSDSCSSGDATIGRWNDDNIQVTKCLPKTLLSSNLYFNWLRYQLTYVSQNRATLAPPPPHSTSSTRSSKLFDSKRVWFKECTQHQHTKSAPKVHLLLLNTTRLFSQQ